MAHPDDWFKELEMLVWRFAGQGFGPDLAGMTVMELAALYAHLQRLAAAGAP